MEAEPSYDASLPNTGKRELLIADRRSLELLTAELRHDTHRRFAGLRIEAEGLDTHERRRWQERLEKAYFDCGCAAATVLGFVCLGAAVIVRTASAGGLARLSWTDGLFVAAAFLAGTSTGKLLARRLTRRRLLRELDELHRLLPAGEEKRGTPDHGICGVSD